MTQSHLMEGPLRYEQQARPQGPNTFPWAASRPSLPAATESKLPAPGAALRGVCRTQNESPGSWVSCPRASSSDLQPAGRTRPSEHGPTQTRKRSESVTKIMHGQLSSV